MAAAGIPVIRTVAVAFRDVWNALRAMPRLVLVSAMIVFGFNWVEYAAVPKSISEFPVTAFLSGVVINLMLTPLYVTLYRHLLTAEVATADATDLMAPRFVRFFGWAVALSSIWMISTVINYVWPDDDAVRWAGWAGALLVSAIVVVRLVILFPGIAIDAPGASVSNSIADTKGHVFNIILIYLAALVPIALAAAVLIALTAIVLALTLGATTASDIPDWVLAAVASLLELVPSALIVGIDARIFQVLADRTLQPST
jgi:hypothetical protein